jgi:hypothetical protein
LERIRLGVSIPKYLLIAVVPVIIVVSGWIAFDLTSANHSQSTTIHSTVIISTTPPKRADIDSGSSMASNGIMMNVTISPLDVKAHSSLTMTAEAFNTLDSADNVTGSADWAFSSLIGACPGGIFSQVLYSGYYTSANISTATAIPWVNPAGLTPCSAFSGFRYIIFNPNSDNAAGFPIRRLSTRTIKLNRLQRQLFLAV